MLGSAPWVTVDDQGNIYVIDGRGSDLVSFAPDGMLRWRVSGPGQGPRDIQRPQAIAWDGRDRVLILNQSGSRLDSWSPDGTYVTSFRLEHLGLSGARAMTVRDPSELTLADQVGSAIELDHLVDGPDWALKSNSKPRLAWRESVSFLQNAFAGIAFSGGALMTGNVASHDFAVVDPNNGRVRRVMRPNTEFRPSISQGENGAGGGSYMNRGIVSPPISLAGAYWLSAVMWVTNLDTERAISEARADEDFERKLHWEWELYDRDGRWLTSRVWDTPEFPEFGTPKLMGPDGKFYTTRSEPFPHVRRYRMTLRPPAGWSQ